MLPNVALGRVVLSLFFAKGDGLTAWLVVHLRRVRTHLLARLGDGTAGNQQRNDNVFHGSSLKAETILAQGGGLYKCLN
jgi:hypothetical protein